MFRLTNTLWFLLALSVLLVGGCKDKYVASADAGVDAGDASVPENTIAACSDGVDNDGDGYTDCLDPECQGFDVCIESDCSDGIDNDGDGNMDCTDTDCQATIECRENTAVACQDSIDNDGDGDTDCDDAECLGFTFCEPTEDICDDNIDNDNDGDTDCDDDDCAQLPICGGFCYAVDFQAPAVWGMAITEANDDLDANAACVQYDVVIQATAPEASTQVCLYVDDINGAAVGCFDPNAQNPISIRVTLCAGEHTLHARVEQGINVCNTVGSGRQQIDIVVYENPSCTITTPAGLSTDQANPTCVTQAAMDLMVTTSGDDVLLYAAGTPFGPEFAVSGLADFTATSLGADADMMIRAHCDNPGTGNGDTWSTDYYITKDTLGPAPQILSPATGASYGISGCPFNMVVTGVEAGQQVCAHYNGQTPLPAACATSTGTSDQHILSVQCVDGLALPVEANTQDACGNPGQATIAVTADTGLPAVLIESPAGGQVYNKAADTIEPATDDFELNIVACTDQPYNPADVTLDIDGQPANLGIPTIQAAACLGLSHRIEWSAPFPFGQIGELQNQHTVEITVSDGVNMGSASSVFHSDTKAPTAAFGCVSCRPQEDFILSSMDSCPGAPVDVFVRVQLDGVESGQPINLAVTSGGSPVGSSPYTQNSTTSGPQLPSWTCIEIQNGQNLLEVTTTDAAGNVAIPAQKIVTLGDGAILSPTSDAVLSLGDDCDAGGVFGIEVQVQVGHATVANGTLIEVFASSLSDGWSYPMPGTDPWSKSCTGDPCTHIFCVPVPTGEVEQSDIALQMLIGTTTVPGGPENITVDISQPDPPTGLSRTVVNRRAAEVQLDWTAVEDAQTGLLAAWEVRCVEDGTLSAANWATARQFAGEPTPLAAGAAQTMNIAEDINGQKIRAGHSYSCGLRAQNAVGLWSNVAVFGDVTQSELDFVQYPLVIEGYTWGSTAHIAAAGDVNGDGYDDMLVGYGDGTGHGAAIYFGSPNGPTAAASQDISCADSTFGRVITGIGDFDGAAYSVGDANVYPDVIVGAPEEAAVYIFRGHAGMDASELSCGAADIIILGTPGTGFGRAVQALGDFDNDGLADIAIGAPYVDGWAGKVYIIFGRDEGSYPVTINLSTGTLARGALEIEAPFATSFTGFGLAAGDLDLDGHSDLVFASNWGGAAHEGSFSVLLGYTVGKPIHSVTPVAAASLDQIVEFSYPGVLSPQFGHSHMAPMDFDGDGCLDLVVGSERSNVGAGTMDAAGNVLIYLGEKIAGACTGAMVDPYAQIIHGEASYDVLGYPVVPPLNHTITVPKYWRLNGVPTSPSDLAIIAGARQNEAGVGSTGVGYVGLWYAGFSGDVAPSQADIVISGGSGAVGQYWAAFVGDLNGDGYVDLAVGDVDYGTGGRVLIYY